VVDVPVAVQVANSPPSTFRYDRPGHGPGRLVDVEGAFERYDFTAMLEPERDSQTQGRLRERDALPVPDVDIVRVDVERHVFSDAQTRLASGRRDDAAEANRVGRRCAVRDVATVVMT